VSKDSNSFPNRIFPCVHPAFPAQDQCGSITFESYRGSFYKFKPKRNLRYLPAFGNAALGFLKNGTGLGVMPNSYTLSRPLAYRLHRRIGQAVVTINDCDLYLGKHGSADSREAYQRTIGEWKQRRRYRPDSNYPATVVDLVIAYVEFATAYYRKDGRPTNQRFPGRVRGPRTGGKKRCLSVGN
jgi:hypothetical protein